MDAIAFWSGSAAALLRVLDVPGPVGLAPAVAVERRRQLGPTRLGTSDRLVAARLLYRQFTSPIVVLLMVAAALSGLLHDATDPAIILAIVGLSGALGFWQEYAASTTVARLLAVVQPEATVVRDGLLQRVPVDTVVPGDIVRLEPGAGVPGDARVIEGRDLLVDEATLTGETYPVEKTPGELAPDTPLRSRSNAVFMGTHVVSGSGTAVVVRTGAATEFGRLSERVRARPPATEFEIGLRRFGAFLMRLTSLFVAGIFVVNVYLEKPVVDSILFALALAVGFTPQLLPAIVSVTLARGARRMARQQVVVRRLACIEDLGSMDVLCSDKTGTLTEGRVAVKTAVDTSGAESARVLQHAYLNAAFQTGFTNPLDAAIRAHRPHDVSAWRRLDEVPYDFARKRLSVLLRGGSGAVLITKGAVEQLLAICTTAETGDGAVVPIAAVLDGVRHAYTEASARGLRTLAVALKRHGGATVSAADERDMTLLGLLLLEDPLRADAAAAAAALSQLGVSLKIITGDNPLVAARVAGDVGIDVHTMITGYELAAMDDAALARQAPRTSIFAGIEPTQKERIVRALRDAGHVVGYMGDGINDAPALHVADVGISVQGAVDVAKSAADIVLLEQGLAVLAHGVREGRRTFANTLKYVFLATSANFGNMFSMAGASAFLPFLPLLPKQVLLTNLLTDVPQLTIATDTVDDEWSGRPHRWDVRAVRRFMVTFGLLSSLFDYVTFAVLLGLAHAGMDEFRTVWFLESVASATLVVLAVRTRRPVTASRPSGPLLAATGTVLVVSAALPFSPLGSVLGFTPVPWPLLATTAAVVAVYVWAAESAKRAFYRRIDRG